MKRLALLLVLLFVASNSFAQTDSCYVYTQIHWAPATTKFVAKIQDNKGDFDIPVDENGEKLYFNSLFNAINYYSSKGWEYVDIYNANGTTTEVNKYAIIRKKMPLSEAEEYTSPRK